MTPVVLMSIAYSILTPIYSYWQARTKRPNVASVTKHFCVLIVVEIVCLVTFTLSWLLTRNLPVALIPTIIAATIGGIVVAETGQHPWYWKRLGALGKVTRREAGDE